MPKSKRPKVWGTKGASTHSQPIRDGPPPTQPTHLQPIHPTQPIRPPHPTHSQLTHPTELPRPPQTTHSQPTHPTQPTRPPQTTHPIQLTRPPQPTHPTQLNRPPQPTHPTQPIHPSRLKQLTRPTQSTPSTYSQPIQLTQPTRPTQSTPGVMDDAFEVQLHDELADADGEMDNEMDDAPDARKSKPPETKAQVRAIMDYLKAMGGSIPPHLCTQPPANEQDNAEVNVEDQFSPMNARRSSGGSNADDRAQSF